LQFLAEFTVEQATKAHKASKPFFIHTTPVMPHWGTCIGPDPPAPGYPPYDPHWEMTALRDPLTGSPAKVPISPCPSHKHRHDFDGQTNKHIASWNVSASGVVPAWMQNKRLDSWDEWREDLGWQNRSAACVDLDDLIAAVLEGFETLGVLNNTFVFFSSECAPQSWPRSLVGATVYAASVS
jgi:arylsulfatase A-like enzyme